MKTKLVAAGVFLLSLLLIGWGIFRDELWVIWNNGKILCLTCIGIK
ncbi:hypothetical protein [Balnearium lithotrophicum]|nr:hypothetical protein [Balnearium lithotrophicum]